MSEYADLQSRETVRTLHPDERCWAVMETNQPSSEPGKGIRRVQQVFVRRGDHLYTFEKDMGPEWAFPLARPFLFPCYGLYSVGEALEQANWLREFQPAPEEPSDLFRQWYEQLDELRQQRAHRTVSGPKLWIQRS